MVLTHLTNDAINTPAFITTNYVLAKFSGQVVSNSPLVITVKELYTLKVTRCSDEATNSATELCS